MTVLSQEAAGDVPESSLLRIRVTSDGRKPYDLTTSGFAHITFYNAVLGKLLHMNRSQDLLPGLLESARWDYASQRYILTLRPGLHFHHGRPVSADDLEFSLVRFFLTTKRADPVILLSDIAGIDKLKRGEAYRPGAVEGIEQLSERSLGIRLAQANPLFLYGLCEGWVSIVPRESLHDDYVTWRGPVVGAGPFRVSHDDPHSSRVRLTRTTPQGKGPRFLEFVADAQDSSIDIAGFLPENPFPQRLQEFVMPEPNGFTGIFFNYEHPLAQNDDFRAAISHAIERTALVAGEHRYQPLNEMLTSNFVGRLKSTEKYDPSIAQALVARLPKELRAKPILAYSGRKGRVVGRFETYYLERLREQLAAVGLNVHFTEVEALTFPPGDRQAAFRLDERGTLFVDPLIPLRAYHAGGVLAPFYPKGQTLLAQRFGEVHAFGSSIEQRAKTAYRISKDFYKHDWVIPLFERKTTYWLNPEKIAAFDEGRGMSFDAAAIRMREAPGAHLQ